MVTFINKLLWPARVKKGLPCNKGVWPILGALIKGVAAGAAKAAAVAAKGVSVAAQGASKAIALAGKGTQAIGHAAKGAGQGLIKGVSSNSSPLALGKTTSPALNASASSFGSKLGAGLNQGIMSQVTGGGNNAGDMTNSIVNQWSGGSGIEQAGGSNPSLGSRLMQRVGGMMQNPLSSQTPNQTTDTEFQTITPPQISQPIDYTANTMQNNSLQGLSREEIDYLLSLRRGNG